MSPCVRTMATLVDIKVFDAENKFFQDEKALCARSMYDLLYCTKYNGHEIYLETVDKDHYIAYVSDDGKPVTLGEISRAVHIPMDVHRRKPIDDEWSPLTVLKDRTCTLLCIMNLSCMAIGTDEGIIRYEGRNNGDMVRDIIMTEMRVPNVLYKEQNGVRFYVQFVKQDEYSMWVVGPAIILPDHPRFQEWLKMLGIVPGNKIREELEKFK